MAVNSSGRGAPTYCPRRVRNLRGAGAGVSDPWPGSHVESCRLVEIFARVEICPHIEKCTTYRQQYTPLYQSQTQVYRTPLYQSQTPVYRTPRYQSQTPVYTSVPVTDTALHSHIITESPGIHKPKYMHCVIHKP